MQVNSTGPVGYGQSNGVQSQNSASNFSPSGVNTGISNESNPCTGCNGSRGCCGTTKLIDTTDIPKIPTLNLSEMGMGPWPPKGLPLPGSSPNGLPGLPPNPTMDLKAVAKELAAKPEPTSEVSKEVAKEINKSLTEQKIITELGIKNELKAELKSDSTVYRDLVAKTVEKVLNGEMTMEQVSNIPKKTIEEYANGQKKLEDVLPKSTPTDSKAVSNDKSPTEPKQLQQPTNEGQKNLPTENKAQPSQDSNPTPTGNKSQPAPQDSNPVSTESKQQPTPNTNPAVGPKEGQKDTVTVPAAAPTDGKEVTQKPTDGQSIPTNPSQTKDAPKLTVTDQPSTPTGAKPVAKTTESAGALPGPKDQPVDTAKPPVTDRPQDTTTAKPSDNNARPSGNPGVKDASKDLPTTGTLKFSGGVENRSDIGRQQTQQGDIVGPKTQSGPGQIQETGQNIPKDTVSRTDTAPPQANAPAGDKAAQKSADFKPADLTRILSDSFSKDSPVPKSIMLVTESGKEIQLTKPAHNDSAGNQTQSAAQASSAKGEFSVPRSDIQGPQVATSFASNAVALTPQAFQGNANAPIFDPGLIDTGIQTAAKPNAATSSAEFAISAAESAQVAIVSDSSAALNNNKVAPTTTPSNAPVGETEGRDNPKSADKAETTQAKTDTTTQSTANTAAKDRPVDQPVIQTQAQAKPAESAVVPVAQSASAAAGKQEINAGLTTISAPVVPLAKPDGVPLQPVISLPFNPVAVLASVRNSGAIPGKDGLPTITQNNGNDGGVQFGNAATAFNAVISNLPVSKEVQVALQALVGALSGVLSHDQIATLINTVHFLSQLLGEEAVTAFLAVLGNLANSNQPQLTASVISIVNNAIQKLDSENVKQLLSFLSTAVANRDPALTTLITALAVAFETLDGASLKQLVQLFSSSWPSLSTPAKELLGTLVSFLASRGELNATTINALATLLTHPQLSQENVQVILLLTTLFSDKGINWGQLFTSLELNPNNYLGLVSFLQQLPAHRLLELLTALSQGQKINGIPAEIQEQLAALLAALKGNGKSQSELIAQLVALTNAEDSARSALMPNILGQEEEQKKIDRLHFGNLNQMIQTLKQGSLKGDKDAYLFLAMFGREMATMETTGADTSGGWAVYQEYMKMQSERKKRETKGRSTKSFVSALATAAAA